MAKLERPGPLEMALTTANVALYPFSCFFTAAKFRALASSLIGLQVICLLSPRRFHGSRVVFPHEWPRYSSALGQGCGIC